MMWDAVVIGSGFGGAMAAYQLVTAGRRVLMLERGGWVARGPQNWGPNGVGLVTPHFTAESPYDVTADGRRYRAASWQCVGGQSVFYGGASFRFRQHDFDVVPEIVGESGAAWPFDYNVLEPFYTRAEQLLGVAGEAGMDPTEPPRCAPFEAGIHWISFASSLGLVVTEVSAHRVDDPAGPDRSSLVVFRYANGAVGVLAHSWELRAPLRGVRLSKVQGLGGAITFESNGLAAFSTGDTGACTSLVCVTFWAIAPCSPTFSTRFAAASRPGTRSMTPDGIWILPSGRSNRCPDARPTAHCILVVRAQ